MIEFITASHDEKTLNANLLRSTVFRMNPNTIRKGFSNISRAYNLPSFASNVQLSCYIHHDVFLPEPFENDLLTAIAAVEWTDSDWGVIGVAGVQLIDGKRYSHGYISDRGKPWGSPNNLPHEVDTLDELLLITKGDFTFDEKLDLDFYGADICMQAKAKGRKNYAINAFCEHNSSRPVGGRTPSFYRCQEYFKNKWKQYLPLATTCSLITS